MYYLDTKIMASRLAQRHAACVRYAFIQDKSTINKIKMLWDKFYKNIPLFLRELANIIQKNRLSYRGDRGWLETQIENITGKRFPLTPAYFALRNAGLPKYLDSPAEVFNKLKNSTLIFFDTETTGLDPRNNQLTEIAAQALQGPDFRVVDTFDRKIDLTDETKKKIEEESQLPEDPKRWTVQKALDYNRYSDNKLEAENEQKVLKDFSDFCDKHNAYILGHNAKFDMHFVNSRGNMNVKNQGVYDTMLFSRYFLIPAIKTLVEQGVEEEAARKERIYDPKKEKMRSRLGDLLKAFSQDISGWHRAIDDVKSTVKGFIEIMNYFQKYTDVHKEEMFKQEKGRAMREQKEIGFSPAKKKWLKEQRGDVPSETHCASINRILMRYAQKSAHQ